MTIVVVLEGLGPVITLLVFLALTSGAGSVVVLSR